MKKIFEYLIVIAVVIIISAVSWIIFTKTEAYKYYAYGVLSSYYEKYTASLPITPLPNHNPKPNPDPIKFTHEEMLKENWHSTCVKKTAVNTLIAKYGLAAVPVPIPKWEDPNDPIIRAYMEQKMRNDMLLFPPPPFENTNAKDLLKAIESMLLQLAKKYTCVMVPGKGDFECLTDGDCNPKPPPPPPPPLK